MVAKKMSSGTVAIAIPQALKRVAGSVVIGNGNLASCSEF
jgi:hypothetical protein